MSLKDLVSLPVFKDAPWLRLIGSALGLLTVGVWITYAAWPSAGLGWLLGTSGVPSHGTAAAIHGWFMNSLRHQILLVVLYLALVAIAAGWVHSQSAQLEAMAGHNAIRATRDRIQYRMIGLDHGSREYAELASQAAKAEKRRQEEHEYRVAVDRYYGLRMGRLASAAWIVVALVTEAGGFGIWWTLALVVAFLIGLLAAEAYWNRDPWPDRLRMWSLSVINCVVLIGVSLVGLIVFLIGLVIHEPSRPSRDEQPTDSIRGQM